MNVANKAYKKVALLNECRRRLTLRRVRRHLDPKADLVVWLHHRYPESWLSFTRTGDTFVKDAALLSALCDLDLRFRIVSGAGIGEVVDSRILYSIDAYNPLRAINYSASLTKALHELEEQGNTLHPALDEAMLWENKVHMHQRFDSAGIKQPPTSIVGPTTSIDEVIDRHRFPLLVKDPHSHGSKGIVKVDDSAALRRAVAELTARGRRQTIVQNLLTITSDRRVTIVGDEIVHTLGRIGAPSNDGLWRPTVPEHGGTVDFEHFPEQWRSYLVDQHRRLGIVAGAWDVCWEHDDETTEPFTLEVSTSFQANPAPPPGFSGPYKAWRDAIGGSDRWATRNVDLAFEIHRRIVAEWGLS